MPELVPKKVIRMALGSVTGAKPQGLGSLAYQLLSLAEKKPLIGWGVERTLEPSRHDHPDR
ncbi:hypothetical protein CYB_1637 [Synechococcus sp. JA-2-3B'a(2-13)]|nr:hypothetical protein CYB_1637 [Synechococcus sp. JA-2-3B'a(2-13)]